MKRAPWMLALILIALAAALARNVQHRKVRLEGHSHWITTDPDSLHQLRRVERIFREGPPAAEFDPLESWPAGSAIPAPPYYPLVAWSLLAPFAPPAVDERRGWLEEALCTLPALFGVLAALAAAWAAREALGDGAALLAGVSFAVAPGAIQRACVGNGDYHSWSCLLALLQLGVLAAACARGALDAPKRALTWGALLGLLHGVAIGSWTPALIQLVLADAVLGLWIVLHVRRGAFPALAHFGLALHLAALLALAPALLSSPWKQHEPWMIVNLSWFHAAYLALAAAVCAPLLALRGESTLRRHYPWFAGGALALLAVVLVALGSGPGAALREAFAWVTAETTFMGQVAESAPLVGPGAGPKLALYLGFGAFAAPLALAALVRRAWLERRPELAPWCAALLVFGALAAVQMRFAELAVVPLAIALWACVPRGFAARPWALALAVAAALGSHAQGVSSTARRAWRAPPFTDSLAKRSARLMSEWLREHSAPGSGVLAMWGFGRAITWAGERGVVASSYGSYVGEEAFLDSFRALGGSDAGALEELLERREVRYVMVTSDVDAQWRPIAAALGLPATSEVLSRSLLGRLMGQGEPPAFLRLVHASPLSDTRRARQGGPPALPSGLVYERVRGARVEARAAPGEMLEVKATLRAGAWSFPFTARARADAQGVARLRLAYSSEGAGDVELLDGLRASIGGRSISLVVSESAVSEGALVAVP